MRLHGPALGTAGLTFLKKNQSHFDFIIAWSRRCHAVGHPSRFRSLDVLRSNTVFTYYGSQIERFDKTAFIAKSDVALKHLRTFAGEKDRIKIAASM